MRLDVADIRVAASSRGERSEGSYGVRDCILAIDSLTISEGERVALVGPNGAGKSTFLRVLLGIEPVWTGSVVIHEGSVTHTYADLGYRSMFGYVGQDPDDQIVETTVWEEVAFGPCNLGLAREEVYKRVDEALNATGLNDERNSFTSHLSGGQKQRLALAGALAMNPRLLVLDEPNTMLDPCARSGLREHLTRLSHQQALLIATHDLKDVEICSRVLVFEHSHIVADCSIESFLSDADLLRRSGCRGEANDTERKPIKERGEAQEHVARSVQHRLTADGVSFSYDSHDHGFSFFATKTKGQRHALALDNITITVESGTCTLLTGENGAGKSTLGLVMSGLYAPTSGEVLCDGRPLQLGDVTCLLQRGDSQLFAATVLQDVAFGARNLGVGESDAIACAEEALAKTGLEPSLFGTQNPHLVSGGEKRRVALAGLLAMGAPFMILDEPTVGLDAFGVEALQSVLIDCLHEGKGIVVISHDLEAFSGICDAAYRLENGKLVPIAQAESHKDAFVADAEGLR